MNEAQYKAMKVEVYEIEQALMHPSQRKNVALILRHDDLCKRIHGYELRHTADDAALHRALARLEGERA